MTKAGDIFDYLNELYPVSTQEPFDNAGFLIGSRMSVAEKVLLSLDVTSKVIEEAENLGCSLIISHHPVIFHKLADVLWDDPVGKKIAALVKNNISVISMHTNLDKAEGGVNDVLVKKLGAVRSERTDADAFLRIGYLDKPVPFVDFLSSCKTSLSGNGLRYFSAGKDVRKFACLGGAGGDELETAYSLGCDTYVTSDIKYNVFLDAEELGMNLIDADHFCTENPVIFALKEKLVDRFPDVDFIISKTHQQVIQFF